MWQIRIQDPSGETRIVRIKQNILEEGTIGRAEDSAIPLRDATTPNEVGTIWTDPDPSKPSPFWLRIADHACAARLGDIEIRESNLPEGIPVQIGESTFMLEKRRAIDNVPTQPAGMSHWLTASESGRRALWMAKKAAATPLSIYIAGETGTGKEVLAHLLHAWSDRASGAFVPLHCGALPLALAESELFGHVKGAFTGAIHQRPGALMQAHNGTLFLDEVGDLPMDIQVKLLRFLENGEIKPVGADRSSKADVRLICATNHPLQKLVEEGRFRRDLYYRLASVTIELPPLRDRPDDVEMLARRFASELGRSLSPKAVLRLQAHAWPGNVRELRHAIERASGLAGPFHPVLAEEAFEFLLETENAASKPELALGVPVLTLEEMERVLLLKALRLSRGNRANAARILGVARSTLFEMLKRHRITGPKSASQLVTRVA